MFFQSLLFPWFAWCWHWISVFCLSKLCQTFVVYGLRIAEVRPRLWALLASMWYTIVLVDILLLPFFRFGMKNWFFFSPCNIAEFSKFYTYWGSIFMRPSFRIWYFTEYHFHSFVRMTVFLQGHGLLSSCPPQIKDHIIKIIRQFWKGPYLSRHISQSMRL